MSEKAAIDQAYQAALQGIFNVFFQMYTDAKGNAQAEQEAEDHYKKGILHLRHIHERAISLIPN